MKNIFFLIIFLITGFGIYQVNSQNLDEISSELQLIKEMKHDFNVPNSNVVYNKTLQSSEKDILSSKDYGNPPNLNWAGQFGGTANDNVCDIVSDGTGNVYVAGFFSGEISFGGETYTSIGLADGIIVKTNSSGNILWVKQLSPLRGESIKAYALCIDGSDNIYVTGYYTGDVLIGSYSLPEDANYNLFFTKLNSSGDILMASYHINSGDNEIGYKIDTDNSGNIYIIGLQKDTPDIDDWWDLVNSNSVILKYDIGGDLTWEQVYPISFNDIEIFGTSIYYVGVNYECDGYLDENITLGYPQNRYDIFYAKSDLDGDFIWGKMASHTNSNGNSYLPYLSIDSNEDIYLDCSYDYSIVLGEDTIISNTYRDHIFVAKCDSAGELLWINHIENNSYSLEAKEISTDINGNSYIICRDSLAKFSTSGIKQWTKQFKYKTSYKAVVNSSDKILQCGDLEGLMFISQSDNTLVEEWFIEVNGNSGSGHVTGMLTDNAGNLYTYGSVSNTTEYFGREINERLFISKQNNAGDLLWLKEFPYDGDMHSDIGTQLYIDTIRSYLYITGELDYDLIIPGEITLTPEGTGIFIVKFDLDGNYIWSVQEDFDGDELYITVDYAGKVILTGVFSGIITIGGTELISEGYDDTFVAKYDAEGNFLWAFGAGGEYVEYILISSTDTMNNIYITGEFTSENIIIDETEITLLEGDGNIVFAKIDPDGNVLWVNSYANSNHSWRDACCWPTGIITDIDGNCYMKGWHGDSTYFGDIMLTSIGCYFNKFITKIDKNGDVLWAKSIKETYHGFDYNQFDIDSEGSVYFGAQVVDTIYFGDDYMYIPKGSDLFVAKYTTNGDLEWVKTMEGGIEYGSNWISSVAVDKYHNVFVGGYFSDSLSLDNQLLTSPNRHGFVVKFGNEIILPTANLICADASICEGDTTDISIELTGAPPWNITYTDGTTPSSVTSNDNIYSFKVSSGGTYEVIALSDANYTGVYFGNSVIVSVEPTPIADYTYEKNDLTVTFTNISENADTYIWDFGDDITSTAINPVRTYLNYGSYQVELSAISNNCGSNIESKTINVSITSVDDIDSEEYVKVIPNPSDGIITLEIRNSITGDVMIELIRSDGLVVYKKEFNKSGGVLKETIDLSNNPDGVYILRIISNNIIRNKKVLINR